MSNPGGNPPVALDYATPRPRGRRQWLIWLVATLLVLGGVGVLVLASYRRPAVRVQPVVQLQPPAPGGEQLGTPAPRTRPLPNTVAAGVLLWGPAAWKEQLLQVQQQCLNYSAPAGMVVYTDDASASGTLGGPGYHQFPGDREVRYRPPVWQDLMMLAGIPQPVVRMNDPRTAGFWSIHRNPGVPTAICFLGELRTASGLRKLVIVDCVRAVDRLVGGSSPTSMIVQAFCVDTASHIAPVGRMVLSPSVTRLAGGWGFGPLGLTVYAGQRDPADPSHFIIRYSVNGNTSVVEGRLKEDGLVEFTPNGKKSVVEDRLKEDGLVKLAPSVQVNRPGGFTQPSNNGWLDGVGNANLKLRPANSAAARPAIGAGQSQ